MLIRYISQLIRENNPIGELNDIKKFVFQDNFQDALFFLNKIKLKYNLDEFNGLKLIILENYILIKLGEIQKGIKLAEEVLSKTRSLNNLLTIDAIISLASAYFEFNEYERCKNLIEEGMKLVITFKNNKSMVTERQSTLIFILGKIFRVKGDLDLALKNFQDSLLIIKDLGYLYDIADHLNVIGIVYATKGQFDLSLEYFEHSLSTFRSIGVNASIPKILNNIGMIYWQKGQFDKALRKYDEGLLIGKELGNLKDIAMISHNIGLTNWNKGELKNAMRFYESSLRLYEELGNKSETAACLTNIGIVHKFKGDLVKALDCYQKALKIRKNLGNKQPIALNYNNIGEIYQMRGDLIEATQYFEKSLELLEEIGNNFYTCEILYNLISVTIDRSLLEKAKFYLKKLEEINKTADNKLINQTYRLAEATLLKTSERLVNKAKAQQLFQEIALEDIVSLEHHITAILNLCELLLAEYRITGHEEVLTEIKAYLSQLQQIAEVQNSYFWLAQSYWLQSKVALMELDVTKAKELMDKSEKISRERGFENLATTIALENEMLLSLFGKLEMLIGAKEKRDMKGVFDVIQLDELINRISFKKLYQDEDEVMDYARRAQKYVEKWKLGK